MIVLIIITLQLPFRYMYHRP